MDVNITIRHVPKPLHAWLKAQAKAHHRSLNSEVVAQLEALRRGGGRSTDARVEDLLRIGERIAALPSQANDTEDDILGYDPETGVPR